MITTPLHPSLAVTLDRNVIRATNEFLSDSTKIEAVVKAAEIANVRSGMEVALMWGRRILPVERGIAQYRMALQEGDLDSFATLVPYPGEGLLPCPDIWRGTCWQGVDG